MISTSSSSSRAWELSHAAKRVSWAVGGSLVRECGGATEWRRGAMVPSCSNQMSAAVGVAGDIGCGRAAAVGDGVFDESTLRRVSKGVGMTRAAGVGAGWVMIGSASRASGWPDENVFEEVVWRRYVLKNCYAPAY
jgi:hypothetical protein